MNSATCKIVSNLYNFPACKFFLNHAIIQHRDGEITARLTISGENDADNAGDNPASQTQSNNIRGYMVQ